MYRLCPMLFLLLSCHVDKVVSETGDAPIGDDTDGELEPDADADGFAENYLPAGQWCSQQDGPSA